MLIHFFYFFLKKDISEVCFPLTGDGFLRGLVLGGWKNMTRIHLMKTTKMSSINSMNWNKIMQHTHTHTEMLKGLQTLGHILGSGV